MDGAHCLRKASASNALLEFGGISSPFNSLGTAETFALPKVQICRSRTSWTDYRVRASCLEACSALEIITFRILAVPRFDRDQGPRDPLLGDSTRACPPPELQAVSIELCPGLRDLPSLLLVVAGRQQASAAFPRIERINQGPSRANHALSGHAFVRQVKETVPDLPVTRDPGKRPLWHSLPIHGRASLLSAMRDAPLRGKARRGQRCGIARGLAGGARSLQNLTSILPRT